MQLLVSILDTLVPVNRRVLAFAEISPFVHATDWLEAVIAGTSQIN